MNMDRIYEYRTACKYVPAVKCDNEHRKEMFTNAYYAACDIIGSLENTFYDYEESDPEYIAAKKYLSKDNHENIVFDVYSEATSAYYGEGFSSGGARAKQIVKSFRFAGKDWTMNVINEIVKSMGY